MAIAKINKTNVSEQVYEQILANISSKEWAPCSKLPSEMELSEIFGVSRVSVRNAIKKFVGQGILESKHGEGTFVSDLSVEKFFSNLMPLITVQKEQLIDLYNFRRIQEAGNIKLMLENYNESTSLELRKNYEEMKSCSDNLEEFVRLDIEFHSIIAKATNNVVAITMYNLIREALLENQLNVQKMFGVKGAVKYHKLILESIEERDILKAQEIMDQHMQNTIENIKSLKQNV